MCWGPQLGRRAPGTPGSCIRLPQVQIQGQVDADPNSALPVDTSVARTGDGISPHSTSFANRASPLEKDRTWALSHLFKTLNAQFSTKTTLFPYPYQAKRNRLDKMIEHGKEKPANSTISKRWYTSRAGSIMGLKRKMWKGHFTWKLESSLESIK